MTYDEFRLSIIDNMHEFDNECNIDFAVNASFYNKLCKQTHFGSEECDCKVKNNKYKNDIILYKVDIVGGIKGGNCWKSSKPQSFKIDIEIEIPLKLICLYYKPEISLKDYIEIEKGLITIKWINEQYYGNSDDYLCKFISIDNLYKNLFK